MKKSGVGFSIDWQENTRNAAPEERATIAEFRVLLENVNISRHLCDTDTIESLMISLYPLADGLAHDWWSILGGRDREVSLTKYRGGYVLPDVRLKFDGMLFEISAHEYKYQNPNLSFLSGPTIRLVRAETEDKLSELIERVLHRLEAEGVSETGCALRWQRVQESRADTDEASFCEAAGALNLDPYEIDDAHAGFIEAAAQKFSGEQLIEFLAGSNVANCMSLLEWVDSVDSRPRYKARVTDLAEVAGSAATLAPVRELEEAWSLGYRRAGALRRVLDCDGATRFSSYKALARRLGAGEHFELAPRVNGLRALRIDHEDGVRVHLRKHGQGPASRASHLFTLARAIGDVACFPECTRSPINDLHSAYRQAAGRAFAAEFLAPICEIESMRSDGRDVVSIAEDFSVATAVVEHQIENAERIQQVLN